MNQVTKVRTTLDQMLANEAQACSPCLITVRRLKDGTVSARMTFAPGMESANGAGATVNEALAHLAAVIGGAP